MTEQDARAARQVMVDELETINKYGALADNADSGKVKDVIEDIADEEKVHVGEAAALLDENDDRARPAMLEGVKEVRSFKEAQTQARFENGRTVVPIPKTDGPLKYEVEPEAHERQRKYRKVRKSVGPSFAEMFANERSRVMEKTGMMTDEAIDEFRKSMYAKAGDFSVPTREYIEHKPSMKQRMMADLTGAPKPETWYEDTGREGVKWPVAGSTNVHGNYDPSDLEVLDADGNFSSPQYNAIATDLQSRPLKGPSDEYTPRRGREKGAGKQAFEREKQAEAEEERPAIEAKYRGDAKRTIEPDKPTNEDLVAQLKAKTENMSVQNPEQVQSEVGKRVDKYMSGYVIKENKRRKKKGLPPMTEREILQKKDELRANKDWIADARKKVDDGTKAKQNPKTEKPLASSQQSKDPKEYIPAGEVSADDVPAPNDAKKIAQEKRGARQAFEASPEGQENKVLRDQFEKLFGKIEGDE